ncbi:MAG: S-layer homology domain-containing protein [Patescibacteria group bacterium]
MLTPLYWAKVLLCLLIVISGTQMPQKAYAAAGQIIKLVSTSGETTFTVGGCFRVDIRVQTDNLDANSVDVVLPYSTTLLEPYDNALCTGSPAISVLTDGLFPSYPSAGNAITSGTISVTGYDSAGTSPVDTGSAPVDQLFAHIFFKVKAAQNSYTLGLDFTSGDTTDTNMAENGGGGEDVLDAVGNLTLQLNAVGGGGDSGGSTGGGGGSGGTGGGGDTGVRSGNGGGGTRSGTASSTRSGSGSEGDPSVIPHPSAPVEVFDAHSYGDVPEDAWYKDAVLYFMRNNALDMERPRFEPSRQILRAEAAKILSLTHGMDAQAPHTLFDDVEQNVWYAPYVDYAAMEGWMRGYEECYGNVRPCFVGPAHALTRAQAATLILRFIGVTAVERVAALNMVFSDVPVDAWFHDEIRSAVSRCILRGDDGTGLLRPTDPVNRAEFVTMFHRALVTPVQNCTSHPSGIVEEALSLIQRDSQVQDSGSATVEDPLQSDFSLAPAEIPHEEQAPLVHPAAEEPLQPSPPASAPVPSLPQKRTPLLRCDACHRCGEGWLNVCDASECMGLGNCVLNRGFSWNSCIPDPMWCGN